MTAVHPTNPTTCFVERDPHAALVRRAGVEAIGPFAVGAWLTAAILATPSGSYANPAVTLGAVFTGGPAALPQGMALFYVVAQSVGVLAAFLVISAAYPKRSPSTGGVVPIAV